MIVYRKIFHKKKLNAVTDRIKSKNKCELFIFYNLEQNCSILKANNI